MGDIAIGDGRDFEEARPTAVPATQITPQISSPGPSTPTTPQIAKIQRLLIIEDDEALKRTLVAALSPHAKSTTTCTTLVEALAALTRPLQPDLIILDVSLPDGTAFEVLDRIAMLPAMPTIIAISGQASPDQSFRLAQRGVRAFLPKPFDLATLERTVESVQAEPPDLIPHLRNAVGHAPVREVEDVVRQTMVNEALGRTKGSKNGAAKILQISRQLLQHMVRATI